MAQHIPGIRPEMVGLMAPPSRTEIAYIADLALQIKDFRFRTSSPSPGIHNIFTYEAGQLIDDTYLSVGIYTPGNADMPPLRITTEKQLPSVPGTEDIIHFRQYDLKPKGVLAWKRYEASLLLDRLLTQSEVSSRVVAEVEAREKRQRSHDFLENRVGTNLFTTEHYRELYTLIRRFNPGAAYQPIPKNNEV